MDNIDVDFGYIINSGTTVKQGVHNDTEDDIFAISFEVQLLDHPDTANGAVIDVLLSVNFGNVILTSKILVMTHYKCYYISN